MHFETESVPAEIPALMHRIVAINGWEPWRRRLDWLQEQVRANPTMPYFISERLGLELAFEQAHRHYKCSNRYPWPPSTAEQQRFYSFLSMFSRCYERLGPKGRTCMAGMLRNALKSDDGFGPLAFEMKTVAHLMKRGFKVEFHDIEEGGGFDYLATNENVEIEIECKFISGDLGRKTHLKEFHQLSTVLLPEMSYALDQSDGGCLVRILIPRRLEANIQQHNEICRLMTHALANHESNKKYSEYGVSILVD